MDVYAVSELGPKLVTADLNYVSVVSSDVRYLGYANRFNPRRTSEFQIRGQCVIRQ